MANNNKECFVEPFGNSTKEEALKVLDNIRLAHPESSGWKEISGYVEKQSDGWHAVRVHEKIS